MGNLMIGNICPPNIQLGGIAVSKIMCGTEQCGPVHRSTIPQGGMGIRINGQTLDYGRFADLYENYEQLQPGEYQHFGNNYDFQHGLGTYTLMITSNFTIRKSDSNPIFDGMIECVGYDGSSMWSEPEYLTYNFDQTAEEHLDGDENYILDITVNETPTPTGAHQLYSSGKDKYKDFGTVYVLRERSWDRYTSHQMIAQYNLLDCFMPIGNGETTTNQKQGNGTFSTDDQVFSGQDYTGTADFEKIDATEHSSLRFETDGATYTFNFSSDGGILGNNQLDYDWVILLTKTGPVIQHFTAQWLGRKYTIENFYSFRSPVTSTTSGAQSAKTSTWIDLITKRQSSETQVIMNRYNQGIAQYTTLWWYNIKDCSMGRRVQIIDYSGRNILDTGVLINGVYKVDPCLPDGEVVLSPTMMSVNSDYTV